MPLALSLYVVSEIGFHYLAWAAPDLALLLPLPPE
jgi:hypothetical protein